LKPNGRADSKEQSVKYLFSSVAACALLLGISLTAHAQTEVTLLVPNPFRRSVDELVPGFESKTGYKLKVTYGKGLGTRRQVSRGEIFDVSILLPPYPEALASGNIDPKSATTLASLTLALAVKKGAPKPDISTPKALKQTLLAAKTVAYVDPTSGSDGSATRDALQKLGVIDLIDSKIKLSATASVTGNSVATGEADLGIFYRNEMDNPGLDVVGLLPKQFATPVKVVAFISTHVKDAKAAKILVDYLSSPDAEALYEKDGLEPAH
jgi:molybdate transport system substrate-binding protein